jgi:transcriptional regulator with XRE-family HTH domain
MMGLAQRPKPVRLAGKLLQIRLALGLSQTEMLTRLGLQGSGFRSSISGYEIGTREPPLPILLNYARLAGVIVDALIDDELDLPESLPASRKDMMGVRVSPVSHRS